MLFVFNTYAMLSEPIPPAGAPAKTDSKMKLAKKKDHSKDKKPKKDKHK